MVAKTGKKKKKETLTPGTAWMDRELKMLMPSEVSQTQKDKYCMIHLHEVPRVISFIERTVAARDGGGVNRELLLNGCRVSIWEDERNSRWTVVMTARRYE